MTMYSGLTQVENLPLDFDDYPEIELKSKNSDQRIYEHQIAGIPIPARIEVKKLAEHIQKGKNAENILATIDFTEIPADDEILQIQAIAEAGQVAKKCLINGHLRFAAYIARLTMGWVPYGSNGRTLGGRESVFKGVLIKNLAVFASAPLPLPDRIQSANEGLMRAAEIYKPDSGAAFITYAHYAVEGSIARAIAYDRNIKIPVYVLDALGSLAVRPETLSPNTFPDLSEVIGEADWDPKKKLEYIKNASRTLSLDQLESLPVENVDPYEDQVTFCETIASPDEDTPQEIAECNSRQLAIKNTLNLIPERERKIIELRFGLTGQEPWTLDDIGNEIGVSRARVRQLEGRALSRLAADSKFVRAVN